MDVDGHRGGEQGPQGGRGSRIRARGSVDPSPRVARPAAKR
jgi:hypothetical protein